MSATDACRPNKRQAGLWEYFVDVTTFGFLCQVANPVKRLRSALSSHVCTGSTIFYSSNKAFGRYKLCELNM